MRRKLEFLSLFCGCGGFDLGFLDAGFSCRAAFDIDPLVVDAYRENLGSFAEVQDLSNGCLGLDSLVGIDVVLAGPPCQGFSTAGKRELRDPRNQLLLRAGKIALRLRPIVFVVENVTGVTKGQHRKYWQDLHRMMRGGGYRTLDLRCDATRLGLAQTRVRVVMIAWRNARDVSGSLPQKRGGTLSEVLAGLPADAPNHEVQLLNPTSPQAEIAKHIAPGQKLCNVRGGARSVHTWHIPKVFGKTNQRQRELLETLMRLRRRMRRREEGDADPVAARTLARFLGRPVASDLRILQAKGYIRRVSGYYDLTHTFNGKFRRLRWDAPAYTVDTRFGDARYFLHPDQHRGFTVREGARIQGFPDKFVFKGSRRSQGAMLGNAVPPPLAKLLAEFLVAQVL